MLPYQNELLRFRISLPNDGTVDQRWRMAKTIVVQAFQDMIYPATRLRGFLSYL